MLFLVLRRFPRVTRRGSSSGGGQICQNAEIPPSFMSLPCIFCKRMHLQYIEGLSCVNTLGLCPKPQPHLRRRRQAVKTQPPDPVAKCWVGSKASRVKCTASPPLTPLHLRESSKTIEADGAGNLSRLAKQPLAAWPLQVGGDPTLCGKGAGGFPCTPATWRTRVWAAPTSVGKTLGGRAVEDSVP